MVHLDNDCLQANLALLPAALAARVRVARALPTDGESRPCVQVHRTLYPLPLSDKRQDAAWSAAGSAPFLVVRVGMGELVDRALEAGGADGPPVVVWESDPAVLRVALSVRDWTGPLADGRLRLVLGMDLLDEDDAPLWSRLVHPVLVPHSSWVHNALREGFDRPRVVLRRGGLLVQEIARALHRRGFQPWLLDLAREGHAQAAADLRQVAPALVVGVNHMVGLPELCAHLGLPLVEWEIDPSIDRLQPRTGPVTTTTIATWRKAHVDKYRAAGFRRVAHLPLSADTRLRRPLHLADDVSERPTVPVVFVGNSMVGRAAAHAQQAEQVLARYLASRNQPARAPVLVQAFLQIQRQQLGRWVVPDLIAARCPGLDAFLRRDGIVADPAQLLGEVIGAEWRLNAVAACAGVGVEVWGDVGWQSLASRGVRHRGPAGARAQLTRIYNAAAINLDIGRAYQRDIVTLRVFDVLACGGFVLAEHSDELANCFVPGVEVAVWRGLADLRAKVRHFVDHPDDRRRIADAGRARVLRDHRLRDRVGQLLELAGVSPAADDGSAQ